MNESLHWYDESGKPAHTQPTKKGAKNATRATNIKDARELKLFPSVSSILKVLSNPGLDRWKMGKVAEACFKQPPIADEQMDEYVHAILDKAFDEVNDAADLGTQIHSNIEQLLSDKPVECSSAMALQCAMSAVDTVRELELVIQHTELTTVCKVHGFAGTTDLVVSRVKDGQMQYGIVDFKSTKTKEDDPVTPKQGHAAQIAAYLSSHWLGGGMPLEFHFGMNIYISTTEVGRIDVVEYDHETLKKELDMFLHACAIWRHRYGYDPRTT
jgi:hypothetical protein